MTAGPTPDALLLVAVGALLMPAVARRFGMPVAVTEIAFGVVVGRGVLGWVGVEEHDALAFVADLGFGLFLFVAALEIDVAGLLREGPRAIAGPLGLSSAVMATALATGLWLGAPWWIGLAMGVSSVPLVLSVLRESRLIATPFGKDLILVAGIGEITSIALLALFDVGADAREAGVVALLAGLVRSMLPALGAVAVAVGLRSLLWWFPGPFQRFGALEDPQELGVRAGFLLMLGGIAVARLGGIEPLLGAFFAGLVVSYVVRRRDVLEAKLAGVAYGFFVPCFFVNVGARLLVDPHVFAASLPLVAVVMLGMLLARVPLLVAYGVAGETLGRASAAALLLAAPLTLQIAVADLGARNGILSEDTESAVVIAAVLAGVVFPAGARRLLARGDMAAPADIEARAEP